MSICVCFSLVLYRHVLNDIRPLLSSIANLASSSSWFSTKLCIYDGSGDQFDSPTVSELRDCLSGVPFFHFKGDNIGFGRANNFNFHQASLSDSDIFLVANPDISFYASDLVRLLEWLTSEPDVACVAPLIVSGTGALQHSAKRNPTVLSLALGRFPLFTKVPFLRCYDVWHKNLDKDYKSELIPSSYLSGCFLIIPARFYSMVGGFSPRYFLHLEDADLVRKLTSVGITLHNPVGRVTHLWARGSHKSIVQSLHLLKSCFIYFRIWGFALF